MSSKSNVSSVSSLLERLERWLARNRPRYRKGLRPGAATSDASFPAELQALLQWHDGEDDGICGALEQNWHLMSATQIAAAKREMDVDALIPFLDDDAGNYLVLDTSRKGDPVRECRLGSKEHSIVATSLQEWLETFVTAVERGAYCEDPERGTFLKRQV